MLSCGEPGKSDKSRKAAGLRFTFVGGLAEFTEAKKHTRKLLVSYETSKIRHLGGRCSRNVKNLEVAGPLWCFCRCSLTNPFTNECFA